MPEIPKNERVWVTYSDAAGNPRFIITAKPLRDQYFLYEVTGEGTKKLGKSTSPDSLAETYNVLAAIEKTVPEDD